MIGIHPIHRRLAALTFKSDIQPLSESEQIELFQCLKVNAQIVYQLDKYKTLSFFAHEVGDMNWQMDLCAKIEAIENRMK
ncbi:DUF7667 family protein [Paenibacillus sp. FSL L8-0506]|uniref:DUF7667 family protein n=1 Tax=Paenibacillus sp. FSL L8-0506 TaxID=2975335 RepID=UPI0030F655C4